MKIERTDHPIEDEAYVKSCRHRLDDHGALVLDGFFNAKQIAAISAEVGPKSNEAFYAASTHNVYLTPPNPDLPADHPFNRQVRSSKGLIADDQIPADSALRELYYDEAFQKFLCGVLHIDAVYPYADDVSSINVHFADEGRELGWHFDNSSFAVTILLQASEGGGEFQYVPAVRGGHKQDGHEQNSDYESEYERVAAVLDGDKAARTLEFAPGALVLFRGRNALHRVTPTQGSTTRLLVVLAYNDAPGIGLSESALETFYGRTGKD